MIAEPGADPEFVALTDKISRERGFGCSSYKEKCLRRRIAVRMRATGAHTFQQYADVLDRDVREYERLLDALTINVTKLFRNWETYDTIATTVIPMLWARPEHEINVWSAGCSSGEEPYSLAVLFHRHAEQIGELHRLRRVRIIGTDIDRESLAAAERGVFTEAAFGDTPPEIRARYFGDTFPARVDPDVRAIVSFERRDLLSDAPPVGALHLITCRNVIIYFDRATQERLFERFHELLRPGGFLVLGKVETLLGRARTLFASIRGRERIFSRA
jgi:chemotaxis methyl-accepting protein methylase